MNQKERPFFLSKDVLDTVNSVSWFIMDASWMLQVRELSVAMIIPTLLSAIFLCYIERRINLTFINVAILSWICMNISWMFSDILSIPFYLVLAKTFFAIGVTFILMAVWSSKNITNTFSHFKRFRIKSFKL